MLREIKADLEDKGGSEDFNNIHHSRTSGFWIFVLWTMSMPPMSCKHKEIFVVFKFAFWDIENGLDG